MVENPSSVEMCGMRASRAAFTCPVVGSRRKSDGSGIWPEVASASTQVVPGATWKVPTTAISFCEKPLFVTAANTGWYWAWSCWACRQAAEGGVVPQPGSALGAEKSSA